jgi:hypothetical protein
MYWGGVGCLVASFSCFGLIVLRNSVWYGPRRSIFTKLKPIDARIAKVGAVLLLAGVLFFVIGKVAR